ncbi:MAG: ATP-binding protein [Deltaproteobacteria bacterium]|nr:ATP-binding protein [Deltaproteobacteria bacterium]
MADYRPIGEQPYGVAGPVSDARMWFGREDLLEFLREELVRPPELGGAALVVVWGARGIGKSSLLARIAGGTFGAKAFPIAIDLEREPRPSGSAGFWRMLGQRAVARLRAAGLATGQLESEIPGERDRAPNERFRKFLQGLCGVLGPARPVYVLDGYEVLERWVHAGIVGIDIIDGLAGILDANLPVSLLFAGAFRMDQRDPETWGRLGVRAVHRKLSFLTPAEAERLIREPVAGRIEYDDGVVPAILRTTACHPLLVQAVCRAVAERLVDEQRNLCTREDLEEALDAADDEEGALPLFVSWWRSLGFLGRVVTSTIASELEDGDGYVSLEQAEKALAEDRGELAVAVDRAGLKGALDALVESEDLERDTGGGYRFRADIVRRWVADAHPIWDVARCVADEPEVPARRGGMRQRLRRRPLLWFWVAVMAAGIVLLIVRLFFPSPDERTPGAGPAVAAGTTFSSGWRLGPDLAPHPARPEDAATLRAEDGRLAAFATRDDGERLDVTVTWPTGVPGPAAGWLDALRHPEESWLWGLAPELAPDPTWLAGADERWADEPPAGAMPPWLGALLAPAARLSVEFENGYPARVRTIDRTGWTRQEWCVTPDGWERCTDDGSAVRRIAFDFTAHGKSKTPLLTRVRFLDAAGEPAADRLGRSELELLYRDVDPDPRGEDWEVEVAITAFLRARPTAAGPAPFAPPPGWQGFGTGGVALSGDRSFTFYYREDRGVGRRGGEIAAVQSRDHVGRATGLGFAWGPAVQTIFFTRQASSEAAFFVGVDGLPAADAAGATGYVEERTPEGVRTRLVFLGPDGKCAAGERLEGTAHVSYCEIKLDGVADPALAPPADAVGRLAGAAAILYGAPAGPAPNAQGVARASVRDLGAATPPCERLLSVQHHDPAGVLAVPAAGPYSGSASTRLAVRFSEGRLADIVRTDCADGPCAQRDVLDETWSCGTTGCYLSNVPLSCGDTAP